MTEAEWVEAHRVNALIDAHQDDLEFGYRFLVAQATAAGQPITVRAGWRLCHDNGLHAS